LRGGDDGHVGRHIGRHVCRQHVCRRDSYGTVEHYSYFDCSWDNENGEHSDQRELIFAPSPVVGDFQSRPLLKAHRVLWLVAVRYPLRE